MVRSPFLKHVVILTSGTALAQVINVAVVPLLTRLYSPQEFGTYVVFSSALAVLGVFSTGRYEYAILAEDNDEEAWHCLMLVLLISSLSSLLVMLVGILFGGWIGESLGITVTFSIIVLAAASLFFSGAYQGAYYWLNRQKRYRHLSTSRVVGALILAIISCYLGYGGAGAGGLICGLVAGQMANFAILSYSLLRHDRAMGWISLRLIACQASKHKDYPKFLIPSSTLDRFSSQSHILLFSSLFDVAVSGALGLYQRVVSLPVRLVGSSFADVFKQHASVQLNANGECRLLFQKTAFRLFLLGLPPFLVLFFAAPSLFALIFGEKWRVGGEYAQILSWMFLFGFVVSPLSSLFFIGKKQKYDLIMQVFLVTGTVSALFVGAYWFDSIWLALTLFTAVYCAKYLLEGWLAWRIASGEL